MNSFKGMDILHGAQFTKGGLEQIMELADQFRARVEKGEVVDLMRGKVLAALFFEPSTRTRLSFETAMNRLGGSVIGFSSAESTSVSKGESLEDTIRTIDQYVDVIAMRHPALGSAAQAAEVADHPVINGGDGAGQHPTQALLDLYTIRKELGKIDGATIVLCGDLKNGRTVHSGVEIYKHYQCRLVFVAPDALKMPVEVTDRLKALGVTFDETPDLAAAIKGADILYMTRIQKERFTDSQEYERLKGAYILTREMVETINPKLITLHPLPRVIEISTEVDSLPGAAYFRQAGNGVFVRMALLALVSGKV
jgi:aspartate carbamoyltransferase catalytic subunit